MCVCVFIGTMNDRRECGKRCEKEREGEGEGGGEGGREGGREGERERGVGKSLDEIYLLEKHKESRA